MHHYLESDKITVSNFLGWVHDQEIVSLPSSSLYTLFGKRIIDIVVASLVILFILSWLIPIIGIIIAIESPGPFFFVQYRSGLRGKPFPCLKFRTMYRNKEAVVFQQTSRNDARVTGFGRFLRRTNLDEMLQFFNVFLGHMSLVGPRPHALSHDAMYWQVPAYRERYWIRPGLTGLAQIRGSRGETNQAQRMEHRIKYDHFYIPRQTLFFDMKICIMTVVLMMTGDKNAW